MTAPKCRSSQVRSVGIMWDVTEAPVKRIKAREEPPRMNTCSTCQFRIPSSSTSDQRISIKSQSYSAQETRKSAMSNTRTGYRTPPCERHHSSGKRHFDTARNADRADQPGKDERSTRSESSAGREGGSEAFGSHCKNNRRLTANEVCFDHAKAKHETSQIAFGANNSGPRDQYTSQVGSWCKK